MSRSNLTRGTSWWRSLCELLVSWWRVDRVRVSPHEGRLSRLDRGALVRIDDEWFEIERRTVTAVPNGADIIYDCLALRRRAVLHIHATATGDAEPVIWREAEYIRPLASADIEVFSRRTACQASRGS